MALRPIIETCEPRPDVLSGGLTDAHFAAQLDQVVRSPEKYPVYGDPTEFFAITYPTQGLRDLLTSTFGRLSGQGGHVRGAEHGVVRFQTSFGGGKTHGLIAAYHLAKGARPVAIGEFVDPELLPDECQVAAVVGDALDPVGGVEIAGRRVKTIWGGIAAQLGDGAWDAVSQQEETRTSPGKNVWVDIFESKPTLVIIDEIAAHMRSLSASGDPDVRRQAEAIPSFLFNLFAAAAEVPTARVIITLATAQDAFGKETTEVEKLFDPSSEAAREAQSVMSRYREVLVPAEDEEIAEILRRRLFARIDDDACREAAEAYAEYYADLDAREFRLGFGADVADKVRRSYPLHPELVKVLDQRVGTIPEFQRTRGALKLLAESVAALWGTNADISMINVGDLPLDAGPVGSSLTRGIGREQFAQVIEADVAGPDSHAVEVDNARFPVGRPFGSLAATTVLLHSLEQTASTGATLVDVWRGVLAPDDDPELVEEALRQLEQSAWHFSYDGSRYRFQTEPNPRKIVEDEKQAVMPSLVRDELDHRIGSMFTSTATIKTKIFPVGPAEIDDKAELQLAVMHYDDFHVTTRTASPPSSALIDMFEKHGVSEANRTFRNGVVFLVADTDSVETMKDRVRYHLAAKRIVDSGERMQSYAPEVQKKLKEIANRAGLDARVAITNCYRHLYYPKADRANSNLRHHELTPQSRGDQERNQTTVIQEVLEGIGKIRSSALATDFLAKLAGFPTTDPIPTTRVIEGFWRNHDADLIINPTTLVEMISAGIRNGTWVYYDADAERAYTSDAPPPAPKIAPTTWLYTRSRAESEGLLRREPTWDDLIRELRNAGGELTGPELRSRLEKTLNSEPTKTSLLEILARVLKQDEAPVVVVDGEVSPDAKPLPSSGVERISLDRLTILTRQRAVELGLTPTDRPSGFNITETAPPGQAFARVSEKLAELGTGKKIEYLEVRLISENGGTSSLRTLMSAPPMLPKLDFSVTLTGAATIGGLGGDIEVRNLSGNVPDFKKVANHLFDLLDRADDVTLDLALSYSPTEPIESDSDVWDSVRSTIIDLLDVPVSVTVRGR